MTEHPEFARPAILRILIEDHGREPRSAAEQLEWVLTATYDQIRRAVVKQEQTS